MDDNGPATQAQMDSMTYGMFIDCGRNAAVTAREMGCTPATVKARVARHVRRGRGVSDEQAREDRARSRRIDALLANILTDCDN